jgi:hypothetical protein
VGPLGNLIGRIYVQALDHQSLAVVFDRLLQELGCVANDEGKESKRESENKSPNEIRREVDEASKPISSVSEVMEETANRNCPAAVSWVVDSHFPAFDLCERASQKVASRLERLLDVRRAVEVQQVEREEAHLHRNLALIGILPLASAQHLQRLALGKHVSSRDLERQNLLVGHIERHSLAVQYKGLDSFFDDLCTLIHR